MSAGEQPQAHDVIYRAEQQIRAEHRVSDPDWQFWHAIADWMNDLACRGKSGLIGRPGNPRASDFNRCVAAAYSYSDGYERRHGQEGEPE